MLKCLQQSKIAPKGSSLSSASPLFLEIHLTVELIAAHPAEAMADGLSKVRFPVEKRRRRSLTTFWM
ncbi:hypothetical protein CSW60_05700 [Caulobacter sp. X]|nr:hypothetical protein CSW60_05700 [Caulobacter sp. X]